MLQNTRGWALTSLIAALGGCQLIIGDIELPPARTQDAELDAERDAERDASDVGAEDMGADAQDEGASDGGDVSLDARPPTDGIAPEASVDAAPLDASDAQPIDAQPIDATPPPEAIYEGGWHVYGLREGDADDPEAAFEGRLDVDQLGHAAYTPGLGAAGEGSSKALELDGSTLQVNLDGLILVGVVDPEEGVGLLMREEAPRAFALLIRQRTTVMPIRARYTYLWLTDQVGAMQHGQLDKVDAEDAYLERESLRLVSAAAPAEVRLDATRIEGGRSRLRAPEASTARVFTPLGSGAMLERGYGAIGLVQSGEDAQASAGLAFGWSAAAHAPSQARRFFCGGVHRVEGALEFNVETLEASEGRLEWGGHIGTLSEHGDFLRLRGAQPLLGFSEMIVFTSPREHLIFLHPMLFSDGETPAPLALEWGFGACVNLWNEAD